MKKGINNQTKLDRRKFLQIVAVAGAVGAGWTLGLRRSSSRFKVVQKSQPMMGTVVNLTLYGPEQSGLESAAQATIERMLDLEKHLSRHSTKSEIADLNRTGTLLNPDKDVLTVLEMAQSISEKTNGAFDVTVLPLVKLQQNGRTGDKKAIEKALELTGFQHLHINRKKITLAHPGMGITLDGIGKGYIVDQGVESLRQSGFNRAYVEAGGDLMVTGRKPGEKPWRIGIRDPRTTGTQHMVVLQTENHAVATSGDYMQAYDADFDQHHIVNPKTGYSPPELASATITAPTVALADAFATAAMVMGHEKTISMLKTISGCEGYFIDKQLNHFQSDGFSV
ncbi:MAG TPA: FAD:protein FMN transferase [Desulfocapsa sulfexigens]|nr:FAD:protein FMN transferase [Desulfocapsa sulfexigens]